MKQALIGTSCIAKFEDAVGYELLHAQMYRHLASQMQGLGYFGAQKMFLAEIPEEQDHFQRHIDFLNDEGVTLSVIPEIPAYKSKIKTLKTLHTKQNSICLNSTVKWQKKKQLNTPKYCNI